LRALRRPEIPGSRIWSSHHTNVLFEAVRDGKTGDTVHTILKSFENTRNA
jgi:hypothetical protein